MIEAEAVPNFPGAILFRNFIPNEAVEEAIIGEVARFESKKNLRSAFVKRTGQWTKYYGKIYGSRSLLRAGINDPSEDSDHDYGFPPLIEAVRSYLSERGLPIDQANVNAYFNDSSLSYHKDETGIAHFYQPWVFTLSLGSTTHLGAKKDGSKQSRRFKVPRRSLLLLSRKSLYCYRHGSLVGDGMRFEDVSGKFEDRAAPWLSLDGVGCEQAVVPFPSPPRRLSINMRKTTSLWGRPDQERKPSRMGYSDQQLEEIFSGFPTVRIGERWPQLDLNMRAIPPL